MKVLKHVILPSLLAIATVSYSQNFKPNGQSDALGGQGGRYFMFSNDLNDRVSLNGNLTLDTSFVDNNKSWFSGKVFLEGQNISSKPYELRLNYATKVVELKSGKEQAYLPFENTDSLTYYDGTRQRRFVNYKIYLENQSTDEYISEVIFRTDDYVFLREHFLKVIKPNYNKALMIGDKDYSFKMVFEDYIVNSQGISIIKNLKDISSATGKNYKELKNIVKENKLDINNANDLEKMFTLF